MHLGIISIETIFKVTIAMCLLKKERARTIGCDFDYEGEKDHLSEEEILFWGRLSLPLPGKAVVPLSHYTSTQSLEW